MPRATLEAGLRLRHSIASEWRYVPSPAYLLLDKMTDTATQKQQLQSSNNAQIKLHTMFQDMMEELEETKAERDTFEHHLYAAETALEAARDDLTATNNRLGATTNALTLSKSDTSIYGRLFLEEYDEHKKTGRVVEA